MPADDPDRPIRLARRTVHTSPFVNLHLDRVRFPGGRVIDEFHLLDFDMESVAVVVVDAEERVLLIQSYRYATDSLEWEIPAGHIDPGESVVDAARREAREETGFEVTDLRPFYRWFAMPGQANQVFHALRGRAGAQVGDFDPSEVHATRWVTPPQLRAMIDANQIRDGFSLTALLLYLAGLS